MPVGQLSCHITCSRPRTRNGRGLLRLVAGIFWFACAKAVALSTYATLFRNKHFFCDL